MDLDVDPAVNGEGIYIVLLFYSVWDNVHIQSHIFESVERCAQIKVPDVDAEEFGVVGGQDGVE